MSHSAEQLQGLLNQSYTMPYGPGKNALLEGAPTVRQLLATIYDRMGQPVAEVYNRRHAATSLLYARQPNEAVDALARADAIAATLPADDERVRWERARLDFEAAHILWELSLRSDEYQPTEAAQRAARAADAALPLGSPGAAAESRLLQAQILLDVQPSEAEAVVRQALDLLPDEADREEYLQVLELARRAAGRGDEAEDGP